MCTIICSLITCFFGFFYLWILGITLTTSGEADLWVRNLQCGSPGRPSWRDHSLTLAAPFSWLGWTAISLITLVIAIVVDIDNLSSNTSNKFSRPALISIIVFLILLLLGGLVHLTICIMNLRQLVAHTHRNSSFLPM
ncbi:hypothetical protein CERSUDRAFT_104531 [Gelatoporia subvermispora B]|uniref:Uncharacterized protein n=1 Tax=Ceriporiopsis subvermispora (strain B) TaxID=914234 RepID=M2QQG8_CERS8|nr:hypothetical protein CERSUDRAFT_104531 [Gelatoporia subvermispora B]